MHPTAEWTARQLMQACGPEDSPRYLIRDRDQVYGERFSRQAKALNVREAVIAPRSPWQNAYAERVIGSMRRECLGHVVVIGERHLLGKVPDGTVIDVPRVGGWAPSRISPAGGMNGSDE